MSHSFVSRLLVLSIAATGLAGCGEGGQLVGPSSDSPVMSLQSAPGWTVVQDASSRSGGVTAVIDERGGELRLGNQSLLVPAGAVDAPTIFNMKKNGGAMSVSLTATRFTPDDVGSAGFAVPVTLSFRYGNEASLPGDPSDLRIVWIRPDGTFEPQPTTVDTQARIVSAELNHLSDYVLASN